MRFIMTSPAEVCCSKCGNKQTIPIDSFDMDSSAIDERDMGAEIEDRFTATDVCDSCGRDFEVSISLYEYPENTHNDGPDVTNSIGCEVLTIPNFTEDYSDDMDEDDYPPVDPNELEAYVKG